MYSMVTIVNNSALVFLKSANRVDLKCSYYKKQKLFETIDVLISLIVVIISQYIANQYILHLQSVNQLSRSVVSDFATLKTAARQASLSITNSRSLFKLMSIASVMPPNHLILCRPLHLPSIFPSIRVFSNKSVLCIKWPKYWSFTFNISPSNEYSGLISFKIDWLDLLVVRGTLKSLLQHHSSKASILLHSAFSIVQLSHPHMTTG